MTIIIDMSPLDTPSRLRGIGQYIMGLSSGLREMRDAGELDLAVDGVARFDWRGRIAGPEGLDYAGTPVHPDQFRGSRYRMRKRLGLGGAARGVGAKLLHVTEALAMPLAPRLPLVLTCYDLIPLVLHRQYLGSAPWARALQYRRDFKAYSAARRIVAISHASKADLVSVLGIDERIVDVTHLGVDHERFNVQPSGPDERERLRARHGLERPFLLYIGAYDPRKNVDLLIRAFASAGIASDFDLVLAGAVRERRRLELSTLAKEHGVESAVRLVGFIEDADLAPLYRTCHLHVFPSKYEGFGLTVAEAMACGAPTIAVNATSVPEVAGDAGVLVPPDDVDALTEAIRSLTHDEAKRRELAVLGPRMADRFRWRECARQTVAAYRQALG